MTTFVKSFKIMTDKEKIELIIQEKRLNNTQFCNEVCIAPGTLSHIRSGRTEPSLNILRSIVQAFPDINPAWLFYNEEPMYRNSDSPTSDSSDSENIHLNNVGESLEQDDAQLNLFASVGNMATPSKGGAVPMVSQANADSRCSVPGGSSSLSVQDIVAETLKQQQKPQRKVVEVRIFFDDGTFETFGAH